MPRSKRKSVAARNAAKMGGAAPAPDFLKRKARLGKRVLPENEIGTTSVRSRKIYIPHQKDRQVLDRHVADKEGNIGGKDDCSYRGLSLEELLVRARHYNAHARATALTTMSRIFETSDGPQTALSAVIGVGTYIAPVLRVGLEAVQDEDAGVRKAGLSTALAVMNRLLLIRPFAKMIAAQLSAALSHIRPDVQLAGARAIAAVFDHGRFHPADIFSPETVNPLPLLAAMLTGLVPHLNRATAANAIAALCSWSPEHNKTASDNDDRIDSSQDAQIFYYHKRDQNTQEACSLGRNAHWSVRLSDEHSDITLPDPNDVKLLPLFQLSVKEAGQVVKAVANVISEYLPIRETYATTSNMDRSQKIEALISGTHALSALVCPFSMQADEARAAVRRVFEAWETEQISGVTPVHTAVDVDMSLASVALTIGEWNSVGKLLSSRLRKVISSTDTSDDYGTAAPSNRCSRLSCALLSARREESELLAEMADTVIRGCSSVRLQKEMMNVWMEFWEHITKRGPVSSIGRWVPTVQFIVSEQIRWTQHERPAAREEQVSFVWERVRELARVVVRLVGDSSGASDPDTAKQYRFAIREVMRVIWEVCRRYGGYGLTESRKRASEIGSLLADALEVGLLDSNRATSSNPLCHVAELLGVDGMKEFTSALFYCGRGICASRVSKLLGQCGASCHTWSMGVALADAIVVDIYQLSGPQVGEDVREESERIADERSGCRLRALAAALACALDLVRKDGEGRKCSPWEGSGGSERTGVADKEGCAALMSSCGRIVRAANVDMEMARMLLASAGATDGEATSVVERL